MFQHILVPLDGSARAERAIPVAARLARAVAGSVVLLRVVESPWEFSPSLAPPLPSASAQLFFEEERSEASSYLAHLAVSPQLAGIETVREIPVGSPAAASLEIAHVRQCDVIVLCRHGYTTATNWTVGGIAEKIARHASLPVLLLAEQEAPLAQADRDPGRALRVLVPLDGSLQAEAALDPAIALLRALAGSRPAELHLLHVAKLPAVEDEQHYRASMNAERQARARDDASAYLAALADRLHRGARAENQQEPAGPAQAPAPLPLSITWSVAFASDVAELLIRTAANTGETDAEGDGQSALIAFSARGRGAGARWMLGSVAERLLRAEQVSVLIVHRQHRAGEQPLAEEA
jgi:nucleotide-binding universal stress UspA family protein